MPSATPEVAYVPSTTVWWLAASRLPITTANRMLAPLLATIAVGVGVSVVTAGAFVAVFELAGLAAPLAGWFVDRVGAPGAIFAGLIAFGIAAAVVASAPNGTVFAVGLVGVGLAANVYEAGAVTWLANTSTYSERARFMGRYELSWAAGLFIGVPVAGVLSLVSWRLAYYLVATTALAGMVLLRGRLGVVAPAALSSAELSSAELLDDSVSPAAAIPVDAASSAAVARRTKDSRVVSAPWLFAAFGLLCGTSGLVIVAFGVWLDERFGLSTAAIGVVGFCLGVGDLVGNAVNDRVTDRIGKVRAGSFGAAVLALSAAALALGSDSLAVGVMALFVLTASFEFALLATKPLLTELGWHRRGVGLGLGLASAAVSRSVAALIGTALFSKWGMSGPATAAVVGAILTTLVLTFFVVEPD